MFSFLQELNIVQIKHLGPLKWTVNWHIVPQLNVFHKSVNSKTGYPTSLSVHSSTAYLNQYSKN